ncbi:MAG TPA: TonB-dependent receptor [Flavobacterium sp.]
MVILLLLTRLPLFAQDLPPVPLRIILSTLENQHNVTFNFIDEDVDEHLILPPEQMWLLPAKLAYLEQKTGLKFDTSSEDLITIIKSDGAGTELQTEFLPEVVVSNYLTTGISKRSDGSYVVTPQKLGILPGVVDTDVLQTTEQLPGIISVDEIVSNISVRGGTHDQNLFLWNGIRMYQTGHFFGLISVFNSMLPNRVNIWKNGTPAAFGESVSSVVQISTTGNEPTKSASGVQIDMISAAFFTKRKVSERASLTVSARRSITDVIATPTYESYASRIFQNTVITNLTADSNSHYSGDEDFYFYDLTAQYEQQIGSRTDLSINALTVENSLQIAQQRSNGASITRKNSSLEQQNYGGSFGVKTKWNPAHQTTINGYISYYNLDARNESIVSTQVVDQQNSVLDTGLRFEYRYKLNDKVHLDSGYQYNEVGITNKDVVNIPELARKNRDVLRTHALITEAAFSDANNKFSATAGLRLNYFENFVDVRLEPRLLIGYSIAPELKLELAGELKSQTLSQVVDLQQDFLGLEKRRWMLADDANFPVQKSAQASLGFTYEKRGWLLTLDSYYKNVDGITSRGQSFQNQLEHEKLTGSYTVLGSEILIQKNAGRFTAWLGYTLNNNNYRFNVYDPNIFDNNFEISHSITCAASYHYGHLKIALGSKWFTGKPVTTPAGGVIDNSNPSNPEVAYNRPNNSVLPDFLRTDLSATYEAILGSTSVRIGASVMNLFNNTNVLNRYYRVDSEQTEIEKVNTFSMRRTPNISFQVRF